MPLNDQLQDILDSLGGFGPVIWLSVAFSIGLVLDLVLTRQLGALRAKNWLAGFTMLSLTVAALWAVLTPVRGFLFLHLLFLDNQAVFVQVIVALAGILIIAYDYFSSLSPPLSSRPVGPPVGRGRGWGVWMVALFWVVMIVFSIVKTKIVHYSSLAWFPVSYLAAYHLHQVLTGRVQWSRWTTVGLVVVGGLLGLVLTAAPLVGMHKDRLISYINDPFAVANLQATVVWVGWEWIIGAVWTVALVVCVLRLRRQTFRAAVGLFLATATMLFFFTATVVPNIERIVQGTVIDFYQSKQGQDVYVEPIGYKSYAQLFYFRKTPPINPRTSDENYLLNGPVDKPTFLIARINNADDFRKNPNLEVVKEENGFVFFKRK